jgi:hypothetical protein
VLGSNVARDAGYPGWNVSLFSSVPPHRCPNGISISSRPFSSRSLPLHHSSFIQRFNAARCKYLQRRWITCEMNSWRWHFVLRSLRSWRDEIC